MDGPGRRSCDTHLNFKILNTRNFVFCFLLTAMVGRAAPAAEPPSFDEVYQLLRTNLEGVSQTDLDRAAVTGLLEQLPGQAMLEESNGTPVASAPDTLSK